MKFPPVVFAQVTPIFADGERKRPAANAKKTPGNHIYPAAAPARSVANTTMFQIVYASTAAKLFSSNELFEWIEQFRAKNARLGITGLLLYKHGAFMQALEGEEEAVRAIFAIIRADQRHHHILTLVTMPVPARQFPDWSMGFKNLGDVDPAAVPGYNPHPALPPPDSELSWQASVAMSLLATFRAEN